MGNGEDVLVMALALPPVWLAATLWWSARHAVDVLRESCAFAGAASGAFAGAPAVHDDGATGALVAPRAARPAPRGADRG